jgi:hypothetical protein
MKTFSRHLGFGLLLLLTASVLAQPQKVTVTKCQDCSNKAAKTLQSCMAGGNAASCQASYKKKMNHCNKKWCNPKTKKVSVSH